MCESCLAYTLVAFWLGALFALLVSVFITSVNNYVNRQKRKRELEEKALKALSLIVGGKKDEK